MWVKSTLMILIYDLKKILSKLYGLVLSPLLILGVSMKNSRTQFMVLFAAGVCTLALNGQTQFQAVVAETDPQAAALDCKAHATAIDKAKHSKHAADQAYSNSALYQGKAGSAYSKKA